MQFSAGQLILFARAPVPGQVKSRLATALGDDKACRVHEQLMAQTLRMAVDSELAEVSCYTTDVMHPWFEPWQRDGVQLCQQQGSDLGQRMFYALQQQLHAGEFAVLFGSDCPVLSAQHLADACSRLQQGRDAVIIGAEDGGYLLIGLRRVDTKLFDNVEWGTDKVLAQTCERFEQLGYDWQLLDTLWDLDTPEDFQRWQTELKTS